MKRTTKRWNQKRPCGFCKVVFPSQKTYNHHVNQCKETPKSRN